MSPAVRSEGPLSGLRVLDLTSVVMGPYATQLLGDMGADVIVVEPTGAGGNRFMGPGPHPQLSGIALNLLRNKRTVSLDLKRPEGRDVVLRIAASCDVFITNLRPGPLARLRLAYEDITAVRPEIIYCQAQGFRTDSARADDPAYDDIIQSLSGVADAARRCGGEPAIAPTILADKVCGQFIVNGVLAALLSRERTGHGQRVEIPMADVMRSFVLVEHGAGAISEPPLDTAGYRRVLNPHRKPQRTADGWIHILPYSREAYEAIFLSAGRPDLADDPRIDRKNLIEHAGWLYEQLHLIVPGRTTKEWLQFCSEHNIPVGEVADLDDLVAELPVADHPVAGPYRVIPPPIWFSRTPAAVRRPAPLVGQDSVEVLREAGYADEAIAELRNQRIVRVVSGK